MFIHLNIHTNYSKMYSANTFQDYLQMAKKLKMKYIAITEVNGWTTEVRKWQEVTGEKSDSEDRLKEADA